MVAYPQDYQIDGTVPVKRILLDDQEIEIAIENITMFGHFSYEHNPIKTSQVPQPDVVSSLERSLKENANIWEELSRY